MSHVTTAQRAQELRKFFAPYDPVFGESGSLNERIYNDGVLQSIAESLMWKLGASRAMVSLVDGEIQYFLAGSEYQETEYNSRLWFGRSSANILDGFCLNTLRSSGDHPIFTVKDLAQDVRFENLPMVNGSIATLGFYSGTPILTARGIVIGSLYVVDDKPRDTGLTRQQEKFLIKSSHRVMQYLELALEAATRPRLTLMSRGIAIFLERKAQIVQDIEESRIAREERDRAQKEHELHNSQERIGLLRSTSLSIPLTNHADQVRRTFQLAAELLKASFNIAEGGVVFFDTVLGFDDLATTSKKTGGSSEKSSKTSPMRNYGPTSVDDTTRFEPQQHTSSTPKTQGRPRSKSNLQRQVGVIAEVFDESCPSETLHKLDVETMESLINRYPDGTVWYFDDEGFFSSSLEQEEVIHNFPTVALAFETLAKEAKTMSQKFPGTRQLIFLPLWDFVANRWCSTCFIWSHASFPVFTVDCEVAYLSAFTNSVMSEISRLDAIVADQIKGEFIGSMSHEFRSPLHGILASAEFLSDSDHSRSQAMLISTIHNCGRTLLDTINHLLDYSRQDSFNKELAGNISTNDEFIPNPLYCVTNIAALCEEVIDGMIMSSGFEDIVEPDPQAMTARTLSLMTHPDTLPSRIDQINLPVMLEMENRNWSFYTQPGAVRRILMNILGNSIKYTKSGFIRITLETEDAQHLWKPAEEEAKFQRTIFKLTVHDSGRGMSAEFLQKSLYTPYIQENILAPGVGLGLSIVRNIVDQLNGTIKVHSLVDKGTSVEVCLPFESELASTPGQMSQAAIDDEYFGAASQIAQEKVIALRRCKTGFIRTSTEEKKATTSELIARYLTDWLDFKVIIFDQWTDDIIADVVIVEEHEESEPYLNLLDLPGMPPILVICNLARCVEKGRTELPDGIAGFVSIPVGPRKLAKVLLRHFQSIVASPAVVDPRTRTFQPNLQVKGSSINIQKASLDKTFSSVSRGNLGALDIVAQRSRSASTIRLNAGQVATISNTKDFEVHTDTSARILIKMPTLSSISTSPPSSTDSLSVQPSTDSLSHPSNSTSMSTPPSSSASTGISGISSPRPQLLAAATSSNIHTLRKSPSSQDNPLLSPSPASTPKPKVSARAPLRMLAVDDNEINLALIRRYLDRRVQDTVDYARNGLEAFENVKAAAVQNGAYDVIFMDLNMPVMDGFQSVRKIREFELMSAGVEAGEAQAGAWEEGGDFFPGNGFKDGLGLGSEVLSNGEIAYGEGIDTEPLVGVDAREGIIENATPKSDEKAEKKKKSDSSPPPFRSYIIALTGLSAERDRKEAVACGIDAFLTKPVRFKNVGKILEERSWVKGDEGRDVDSGSV